MIMIYLVTSFHLKQPDINFIQWSQVIRKKLWKRRKKHLYNNLKKTSSFDHITCNSIRSSYQNMPSFLGVDKLIFQTFHPIFH